ncbi:hydrogen peroxide-dependent heme synthase [uncultured Schumannella sp.]|uniref:hydrogen peroxide-dependent heme synthase n=1 Tax=uncultured Schumannella sp. TaxID=1195956 RepID=UPI0025D808DA|nr:hydrogen peroxide-dependent heme synthase [uncultured Schumannella sp.]
MPSPSSSLSGFALWAVFQRPPLVAPNVADSAEVAARLDAAVAEAASNEVVCRGIYDVSGLRADADLMVWLHGPSAEGLQRGLRDLRRDTVFGELLPVWNAMGVHRDAEFNRAHVPGFLRGEHAREWLTVYPFVRSYEWYLLPEAERRAMLAEHGRAGAAFTSVVANTVASFALGDFEWILPMESDSLTDLVDMMRDLRATDARRHVREEVPFYTGRRITTAEVAEVLA